MKDSKQIQISENRDLIYSSFRLQKTSLIPIGKPTYDQWSEAGKLLSKMDGCLTWWVGDWANYGEKTYENFTQEFGEDLWEYNTFRKAKWLCERIPNVRRRTNLSPSHHEEVISLDEKKQDYWLEKAEKDNLSREELRIYLREEKLDKQDDDIDDRKITPYGENIFYLSSKYQDFPQDFVIIKDGEKWPTLKRRSWFYHDDNREYSLREYAEVQTFPIEFRFVGTYEKIKDQIGNAVAPQMAKFVGKCLSSKTFGDLFAGCGGLSYGLEQLGKKAIWAIERSIDYARTYKINHPQAKVLTRDIKKVDPLTLPKVDIIVGGPPCQGFSLSGIRFKDDPRNDLYKEFVRFVKVLEPKEFLLENVPQIQQVKDGIIKDFQSIGYQVETMLVKGEEIGMRQHRHRFFFIGRRTK